MSNGWYSIGSKIKRVATANSPSGYGEVFAVNTAGTLFQQTEQSRGGYRSNGWYSIATTIAT